MERRPLMPPAKIWSVIAAATGCVIVAVLVVGNGQDFNREVDLFGAAGFGFDSNLPVQWDRSASVDLDGLSRYYSAASAHLRNGAPHAHMALKMAKPAREMSLAQLPTQQLGQDKDWNMRKWSPEHYIDVAAGRVDSTTTKGIWKSKDEPWAGIDEVLPTDTRYEYQTMHSGHGQEAKMEAFLDHAHHQLKILKDALPKLAAGKDAKKELDKLNKVISVGEDALEKIERDTVIDDAMNSGEQVRDALSDQDLGLSDKFKVAEGSQLHQKASSHNNGELHGNGMLGDLAPDSVLNIDASDSAVWAPGGDPFRSMGKPHFSNRSVRGRTQHSDRRHYETSRQATSEMQSYFASLDKRTEHENRKNARRAGEAAADVRERRIMSLDHSTQERRKRARSRRGTQQLRLLTTLQHEEDGARRRLQAMRFIKALSSVLKPEQLQQLKDKETDSCHTCIAVLGCRDCCELFCSTEEVSSDEHASSASAGKPLPVIPKCPIAAAGGGEASAGCEEEDEERARAARTTHSHLKSCNGLTLAECDSHMRAQASEKREDGGSAALAAGSGKVSDAASNAAVKLAAAPKLDALEKEVEELKGEVETMTSLEAKADEEKKRQFEQLEKELEGHPYYKYGSAGDALEKHDSEDPHPFYKVGMAEAAATRSTDTRTLLPRAPCECTTAECKECPERADSAASRSARARTLLPRAPCECTTAECKECPERTDAVRARRNAQNAQEQQRVQQAYPAADATKFKALFEKAVREAGKAAVKEAVADELAEERRVRVAVQKEMAAEVKEQAQLAGSNKASKKATSSSSSSSSKAAKGETGSASFTTASSTTATTSAHAAAICDCETADCSNCPGAQGMWKGKDAKAAAIKEENEALKKAEVAVATSNAILRERVAALEATNAMAIRQGLGVYGDMSGDDSEWKAREPFPGKSETLGNTVSQPVKDLEKQLFGARREVQDLKSQLKAKAATKSSYIGKGKADNDVLPFYEQPAYGGQKASKYIREYKNEEKAIREAAVEAAVNRPPAY